MTRAKFTRAALALLTTLVGSGGGSAHAHAQGVEVSKDESKFLARRTALLIEQFTRYIEWPESALPADGTFVLCLQGQSDTALELTNIAAIRRFKRRPTDVRRVRPSDNLAACHVLYLAPSEGPRLRESLSKVIGKAVLIVSDSSGFVQRGVHFNFFPVTRAEPKPGTYPDFEWSVPSVRRTVLLRFHPGLLSQGRKVDASLQESDREGPPGGGAP